MMPIYESMSHTSRVISHKLLVISIVFAILAAIPFAAHADVRTVGDVVRVLNRAADWLFSYILVPFTIIFFLLAGFNYLTAQGNPEKLATAHRMILYAVISLAVGIVARGIAGLVDQLIAR